MPLTRLEMTDPEPTSHTMSLSSSVQAVARSMSLTVPSQSSMIFAGLISRCAIPIEWRCAIPRMVWNARDLVSASDRG